MYFGGLGATTSLLKVPVVIGNQFKVDTVDTFDIQVNSLRGLSRSNFIKCFFRVPVYVAGNGYKARLRE